MRTAQVQILVSKKDYLKYGLSNKIINFRTYPAQYSKNCNLMNSRAHSRT